LRGTLSPLQELRIHVRNPDHVLDDKAALLVDPPIYVAVDR
jgi:hypothetical protein